MRYDDTDWKLEGNVLWTRSDSLSNVKFEGTASVNVYVSAVIKFILNMYDGRIRMERFTYIFIIYTQIPSCFIKWNRKK